MAFTYFFRDAEPLELAIDQMLPIVRESNSIDLWDAGCAHGPEPYTLAILCREKMPERLFRRMRILASDVDCGFAAQVGGGVFPESELRRLPAGIRDKYFRPQGGGNEFEVVEEIRSKIEFLQHDLLSLRLPATNVSLIVCKNVLLHFGDGQRCDVLRMFHAALRPGGVLVTEHTQKMPAALDGMFRPLVCHAQVHGKLAALANAKSKEDGGGNIRLPNFINRTITGKPENERSEKGDDKIVRRLPRLFSARLINPLIYLP
jgi:chemotaxis protein methyltransferase CheR